MSLRIDQRREVFGGEELLGDLLDLRSGDGVDMGIEGGDVFLPAPVEETLAEVEGEVLPVIAGHADLTFELLLRRLQLPVGEGLVHKRLKLTADEFNAAVDILGITTEIDAPDARIAIAHHGTLYGVDEAVVLAQGNIEFGVHARSAEDIIQQI